jgi:hypothetical protein
LGQISEYTIPDISLPKIIDEHLRKLTSEIVENEIISLLHNGMLLTITLYMESFLGQISTIPIYMDAELTEDILYSQKKHDSLLINEIHSQRVF